MSTPVAAHGTDGAATGARPALDLLWEERIAGDDVRGLGMPPELERRYGGQLLVPLRPDRPTVIANFVSTLDGIVALGGGELSGGGLISGFHEPDRFVMGLLRAIADFVVVGAGTVRDAGEHAWTAPRVHPRSAVAFAAWRASLGLSANPTTVVVTGSGDIPVRHPGLTDPTVPVIVATTPAGARRLAGMSLAPNVIVEPVGSGGTVGGQGLVDLAGRLGARLMLTEGGPHLLGELVRADLLDELFLTVAPQLVGRVGAGRLGLVEGLGLAPADSPWHDLASVRKSGEHLLLRYRRRAAGHDVEES
jgi:riboflavin biosynthesis pyrimidine reductase